MAWLISYSVLVFSNSQHINKKHDHSHTYVHGIVLHPTAGECGAQISEGKNYYRSHYIEDTLDGKGGANMKTLHGLGALGADELIESYADEHE